MHENPSLDETDEEFSEYLAACHEALVAGETTPPTAPPHLCERLRRAQSCLFLLAQARPKLSAPPRAESGEPQTIGRFRIVRELGRGGCGVVFLAHDPALKRDVALKIPLPEMLATPELRRRFLREAQAAAQLNHPNVVAVHESGEVGPLAYIAYAYCPGPSLSAWLRAQKTPMTPGAAAALVLMLAEAVQHCHARGILHRDLKPSNILLRDQGRVPAPMITDFGLARVEFADADRTRTGTVMGTAAYMAPEQALGNLPDIGPHTDVYALGAILFELLAGQPPFKSNHPTETMRRVIHEEPPAFATFGRKVHRDLDTICRKCLEKEPRRRYASAAHLADDLQRFLNGEPILARPIGGVQKTWRWCWRHPALAALLSLIVLVLIIVLPGWYWYDLSLQELESRRQRAEETAQQELQARQAAEANANTERYFSLLNRLRQRSSQKPLGWTWAGLQDLRTLAQINTAARNAAELRSEAATVLAGVDLRPQRVLAEAFHAYCLAFSPDGRSLAAGQHFATAFVSATIRVYDCASGQVRHELSYPAQLVTSTSSLSRDGAVCLAYSADGKHLAVGTRSGQVHCWNLTETPPKLVSWSASAQRIHEICFHPKKPEIYSASHGDHFFKRWNAATGKELAKLEASKGSIHGLAVHKDGRTVAAIVDNKISYFDAESLRDLGRTRANDEQLGLFRLRYSPDGRFLAVEASNGMLLLLDPEGEEVRHFAAPGGAWAHNGPINRMEFSPDGSLLFSSAENDRDRTLKIWELASGRLLVSLMLRSDGPLAFAVHPHGKSVATSAGGQIVLHELAEGMVEVFRAQHPHPVRTLSFSKTGAWMACSSESRRPAKGVFPYLTVWQTEPMQLHCSHKIGHVDTTPWETPAQLTFHPEDPILACTGWAADIRRWDFAQKIFLPEWPCQEPAWLAFDRDGKKLWTISGERTVQSRHWPTGAVASSWRHTSLKFHERDQLHCLAIGRRWVLAGDRDGQTHLLRADDGQHQASWPGSSAPIRSTALNASEMWAAVGSQDGLVRILSIPAGKVLATCHDQLGSVDGLVIDPAGHFLISCGTENRLHVYALQGDQPQLYAIMTLPAGPVRSLNFHPQGKQFAFIAGAETAVRWWDLERFRHQVAELGIH